MYPIEGVETTTRRLPSNWAPWRGTFGPPPIPGAQSTIGGDFFVALYENGEVNEAVAHINDVRHGILVYRDERCGMEVNGFVVEWCNCHATTEAVLAVRARFWLAAGRNAYCGRKEDLMPGLEPVWHKVPLDELVIEGLVAYGEGLWADEITGCLLSREGDLSLHSSGTGRGCLFPAGVAVVIRGATGSLVANLKTRENGGVRRNGPQFRWGLGEPPGEPRYGGEWVVPTAPWPES